MNITTRATYSINLPRAKKLRGTWAHETRKGRLIFGRLLVQGWQLYGPEDRGEGDE